MTYQLKLVHIKIPGHKSCNPVRQKFKKKKNVFDSKHTEWFTGIGPKTDRHNSEYFRCRSILFTFSS